MNEEHYQERGPDFSYVAKMNEQIEGYKRQVNQLLHERDAREKDLEKCQIEINLLKQQIEQLGTPRIVKIYLDEPVRLGKWTQKLVTIYKTQLTPAGWIIWVKK